MSKRVRSDEGGAASAAPDEDAEAKRMQVSQQRSGYRVNVRLDLEFGQLLVECGPLVDDDKAASAHILPRLCALGGGHGLLALGDLEQRAPPSVELLLRRERFREQDDLPKWRSVPPPFTATRAGSFSRRKSGTTSRLLVVIDTNGFVVEIAHELLVLRTLDR